LSPVAFDRILTEHCPCCEARFRRLGSNSSRPAQTLHKCLGQLNRASDSDEVLRGGHSRRPEDGELRLTAAMASARAGKFRWRPGAPCCRPRTHSQTLWRRTAAQLAEWRADHTGALVHWEEILAANPLDSEALRAEGTAIGHDRRSAARARVVGRMRCKVHPIFFRLRQLRLEWLRPDPPVEALREVEDYLAFIPPTRGRCARKR